MGGTHLSQPTAQVLLQPTSWVLCRVRTRFFYISMIVYTARQLFFRVSNSSLSQSSFEMPKK